MMKKNVLPLIAAAALTVSIGSLNAKTAELHTKPAKESEVIASIDLNKGYIPIYKKGNWLKVGDPHNGNTGWMPLAALKQTSTQSEKRSDSQRQVIRQSITRPDGSKINRVFEYAGSRKLSEEQVRQLFKKMQTRQENFERMMAKNMREMRRISQKMFQEDGFFDIFPSMDMPHAAPSVKKQQVQAIKHTNKDKNT